MRKSSLLSPLALAAALAVSSAPLAAMAMPAAYQAGISVHSAAVPADYMWQGQHYSYHYHGKYYRHRRHDHGHWDYY